MRSQLVEIGPVPYFPAFTAEKVYMRRIQGQLPHALRRWQSVVDAMMSELLNGGL
jgi:hypothetical protein